MKSAIHYSQKQIRKLTKLQKQSRHRYLLLSFMVALLNLAVIILAAIAIHLLISDTSKNVEGNNFKIIMASLAAGSTILIFFLNLFSIIYRGVMKFKIYKNSIDEIEHLIAKHRFAPKTKGFITIDKLVEESTKIYNKAIRSKRKNSSMKSAIGKALVGADNA